MMNEGCATFVHYRIMNRLHETGQLTDGAMLEFLHSHTSVVFQPDFDDPRYSGINPYALGFAMMQDIERICREPDRRGPAVVPGHRRQSATRCRCCATSGPTTATRASSGNSSARA